MAEEKYNEKMQVRRAYIEENASKARALINELVLLDNDWTYEKDNKRLQHWMAPKDPYL